MITIDDISCVLVTRGDVDLRPILNTLPFNDIVIWDNSRREDQGIYGRYAAIAEAKHDVIYTQDDDLLVDCFDELCAAYEPGLLTVNYAEPWDIPWVACGSVFDRTLPQEAFDMYFAAYPRDEMFTHWVCDAVFGLLTPTKVIDHGHTDLPHGNAPGRVSTTLGWYTGPREEVKVRCRRLLDM